METDSRRIGTWRKVAWMTGGWDKWWKKERTANRDLQQC